MNTGIAPELWFSFGEFSEMQDLNSLSQSSKFLTKTLRPLLYRFVDLSDRDEQYSNATKTITLLSKDKALARCVREIYVGNQCLEDETHDLDFKTFLEALSNTSSLRSFHMHTPDFKDTDIDLYTPLLHILQSKSREPIREVCLRQWHPIEGLPKDDDCFLRGMQIFECIPEIDFDGNREMEQLIKLAKSSQETLCRKERCEGIM